MKTVKDVLESKGFDFSAIAPDASVLEATRRMADQGIGSLLVMKSDKLVGLLSERDIVYTLVHQGKPAEKTPVAEIMSTQVLCVTSQQTVEECMALMTEKRVRHLPVVEEGGIIGVISIGDAVKAIIADQQFVIEQLENYISG